MKLQNVKTGIQRFFGGIELVKRGANLFGMFFKSGDTFSNA